MAIELHGYQYSVYSWIARLALHEKGKAFDWIEVNPFAEDIPASYLAIHPFKRVPALIHDGIVVYETGAITRYVDEAFEGRRLQPEEPRNRARCNQIISIVDSYAYWPLVRQVFSHGVFRPMMKLQADEKEFQRGLEAAPRILSALEDAAGEGRYLCGDGITLADIHLAPMIGYFARAPEGRDLLQKQLRLSAWWADFSKRATFMATSPRLPPAVR
ncbi:glutathione S-transferase family protein [Bradyrhizobium diazoefficiens]|uniref:glutathione S-transferase family protein n=1 Tax=Bradyrhizobium diazoefficiens TaxID=1355477 RepID=UPI00190C65E2|nr:glutathione S-transferase family protein [Bradyrhizobium diazoefficiens]QQO11871.1 glutathione S-transferase family protein [Bradyrhizobium diazoefficiens]